MRARSRGAAAIVAALALPPVLGAQQLAAGAWAGQALLRGRDTLPGLARDGHAAALGDAIVADRRRVHVLLDDARGALRPLQAPAGQSRLEAGTEGERRFGAWTTAAAFAWARAEQRGLAWSNTADATDGSLYVWADSVGGDWRRDDVRLRAALASPARRRVAAGARVTYDIGQGARQTGGRPLWRRRDVAIAPSLVVALPGDHRLGVSPRLAWRREEGEYGALARDLGAVPRLFRLRGFGAYDATALQRAERATQGRWLALDAGYEGTLREWRTGAAFAAAAGRDSVSDGLEAPTVGGVTAHRRLDATLAARRAGSGGGHELRLHVATARRRGIEPLPGGTASSGEVAATETWSQARVELDAWRGDDAARPRAALGVVAGAARLVRRDVVTALDARALLPFAAVRARAARGPLDVAFEVRGVAARDRAFAVLAPVPLTDALTRPDWEGRTAARAGAGLALGWRTRAGRAVLSTDAERARHPAAARATTTLAWILE